MIKVKENSKEAKSPNFTPCYYIKANIAIKGVYHADNRMRIGGRPFDDHGVCVDGYVTYFGINETCAEKVYLFFQKLEKHAMGHGAANLGIELTDMIYLMLYLRHRKEDDYDGMEAYAYFTEKLGCSDAELDELLCYYKDYGELFQPKIGGIDNVLTTVQLIYRDEYGDEHDCEVCN